MPRKINSVAILGGGLMGSGIATALILSNYRVILKEVNDKFLQAGIGRVKGQNDFIVDPYGSLLFYICKLIGMHSFSQFTKSG